MIKFRLLASVALATMALSSCDDDTLNIGNSLTTESDKLDLSATTYYANTRTIVADSVLSLSNNCYFGKVKDPETGADVTSEFTTQFHLLETTYISPEEKIVGRYDDRASADSCDIILYIESPFKAQDSLVAMKMRVSELSTPMEEGHKYYSNYSPLAQGNVKANGLKKNKLFTYENLLETDSARTSSTYQDNIRIALNQPYTDAQGVTYNNYGTYLMRQYYDHPEYYRNSYTFIHTLCPGFFFEITDGLGFHAKVSNIGLRIYYTLQGDTAQTRGGITLAGTKEVLQTTHVTNDMDAIRTLAQQTSHTYLKSPAGLFTEVTLPVEEIKKGHEADSLIATKIVFQRLNNQSADSRMLGIPQTILMVQRDSLYSYFENNDVPDSKTSFYTSFTSSANTYTFSNISNLVTYLWEQREQGLQQDANWLTNHPNWNRVVLVPITTTSYTTTSGTTITHIEHDMSLTSTRLVGGKDSPIAVSVVYANFR